MLVVTSQATERNKAPILAVLRGALPPRGTVLEVGSGGGEHAGYFASHLPQLAWQPSEVPALLPQLAARLHGASPANLRAPLALDVRALPWPVAPVEAVFSANTLHIMSWEAVTDFFRGVGGVLAAGGVLCVYGPFNYGGRFTSDSNAQFDAFLRERDPYSGIRDFEALERLAAAEQLEFCADHEMPANNRTLVWRRRA
jgi:cyclopropane fatty-acyl-phospholipid synthase-like methyltransferase